MREKDSRVGGGRNMCPSTGQLLHVHRQYHTKSSLFFSASFIAIRVFSVILFLLLLSSSDPAFTRNEEMIV